MRVSHFIVTGRVQGVRYRACTREEAQRLGLKGWVRNLPSGEVEVYCQGDEKAVEQLLRWCGRGPALARVDHIRMVMEKESEEPLFENFEIRL